MDALRQADPARLSQILDPGGDIDTVTENVVVVEDDVPHMDADAELDPLRGRQRVLPNEYMGRSSDDR